MKKLFGIIGISILLITTSVSKSDAQVFVEIKPVIPTVVIHKPAVERSGYIWIDGHWHWSDHRGHYTWVKGHWKARKKGCRWVPGRWESVRGRGYRWSPGYWKPVTTARPHVYNHDQHHKRSHKRGRGHKHGHKKRHKRYRD